MKGTVTVVLAVLLAMVIVFPGGGAVVFAADSFPDVPESHWASSYIDNVREVGIFQGFPDGAFRPENTVTYGEFLKMTALSLGEGNHFGATSASSHWASPYYEKGLSEGWFSEREIPQAYLDRAIPREHMALILCGTLDSSGIFSFGGPLTGITDIHAGNPYAFEISVAYSEGLLNGYPDGSFRPKGNLTRAEAAAVLWRLLEKMKASEALAKVPADVPSVEQAAEGFTEKDDSLGYFRQDFAHFHHGGKLRPLRHKADRTFNGNRHQQSQQHDSPKGIGENLRCTLQKLAHTQNKPNDKAYRKIQIQKRRKMIHKKAEYVCHTITSASAR